MFRQLITVATCLIFLPWQAALCVAPEAEDEAARGTATASSIFGLQYQRLQAQLQRHRALADAGGWPEVPDGPTIRPGSSDPRLPILARRLAISGDLAVAHSSLSASEYDEILQDAVRRFQVRHGLEADALVGRATLRSLNVPVEQRIDQIQVNLERMRPLSDIDEEQLVLVNIAAFGATVIRDGRTVWSTKVIVGEQENETPELRSNLQSVVFNPTWSVPHSIASKELLPRIKQDPDFFTSGGYRLRDRDGNSVDPSAVDWGLYSVSNFPFRLVQRPGPANQLGQIKFIIPNPYSVCMHDTPAKSLFANANRALSHGCIRIDNPMAFAEFILGNEGWTREEIDSQIDAGGTKSVALSKPLPVYVFYWTAETDDMGRAHFYEDIYERDAEILDALKDNSNIEP